MITYSSVSMTGARELNEDSFVCLEHNGDFCFVVADGLGGHGRGEVASAVVVQEISDIFLQSAITAPAAFVGPAIHSAQNKLLAEQVRLNAGNEMKTTVVMLCVNGSQLCWGHVGDTRLYAFRNNTAVMRTMDHSIPQMLVLSGKIPEKKIRNHPNRNMLMRVLGVEWEQAQYDVSEVYDIMDFQAFLMCSDGFWELITEKQMEKLLKKSRTVDEWLGAMAEIVQKNGTGKDMDNCTAIAVFTNS